MSAEPAALSGRGRRERADAATIPRLLRRRGPQERDQRPLRDAPAPPQVFMPVLKEARSRRRMRSRFRCEREHPPTSSEEEYLVLFAGAPGPVRGEASATYLWSPTRGGRGGRAS